MSVTSLDSRRPTLGGSTIGAACGIDPYVSPIRLWLDLTQGREREETEAMRWGKRLEPVIFDALVVDGYDVRRGDEALGVRERARPWLIGHPDGFHYTEDDAIDGIVEAKCSARGYDSPPAHYLAQVQTYMHLTGLDGAIIATLSGLHLDVVEVDRDDRGIATILHLAEQFMEHVRSGVQPAPMGHADDRAALLDVHPDAVSGKRVRETREIRDARRELVGLLAAEKARKARIEHLRALVTDHMADADTLVSSHDEIVATWKGMTARRLDTAALKAQRPDVYTEYATETETRRLILT